MTIFAIVYCDLIEKIFGLFLSVKFKFDMLQKKCVGKDFAEFFLDFLRNLIEL